MKREKKYVEEEEEVVEEEEKHSDGEDWQVRFVRSTQMRGVTLLVYRSSMCHLT